MSKRIWRALGVGLFWLLWPALVVYLRRGERARILIVHGDEVLLVRSWLGTRKWSLPGGGLHSDEPILQGCLRELREETGIVLAEKQVTKMFSSVFRHGGFRYLCHYFVAVLPEKPVVMTQKIEILDYAWVNRHELTAKNVQPDTLTTVTAWFEP
jgi:8-oxo-dGTP pyrophosphatase MutT (NUDIX family)